MWLCANKTLFVKTVAAHLAQSPQFAGPCGRLELAGERDIALGWRLGKVSLGWGHLSWDLKGGEAMTVGKFKGQIWGWRNSWCKSPGGRGNGPDGCVGGWSRVVIDLIREKWPGVWSLRTGADHKHRKTFPPFFLSLLKLLLCAGLCAQHSTCQVFLRQPRKIATIVAPNLQMRKLRSREAKKLTQGHPESKWASNKAGIWTQLWLLVPKLMVLTTYPNIAFFWGSPSYLRESRERLYT